MSKSKIKVKFNAGIIGRKGPLKTLPKYKPSSKALDEIFEAKKPEYSNILLQDLSDTFRSCLEIAIRKNNDYAGNKAVDVFKNIRASEMIGVRPEKAIMVRLMDKMSRVSNLLDQEAAVKDESIEDTLNDIINYTGILKSYIKNHPKNG